MTYIFNPNLLFQCWRSGSTELLASRFPSNTSSISSPDVAVNTSHVAYGNVVPKSLPGKLGTMGKEALQRHDATIVVASIAQQAASAMGTLVKIMKYVSKYSKVFLLETS